MNLTLGFLIYLLFMIFYAYHISTKNKIENLNFFLIKVNYKNHLKGTGNLIFSIITATKDQLLSVISPYVEAASGVALIIQQRLIGVIQIFLSGIHLLLPLQVKAKKNDNILRAFVLGIILWLALSLFGGEIINVTSILLKETVNVSSGIHIWLILWSPVVLSLFVTWLISLGKAKIAVFIEILQILLFLIVLRTI
jgi:hypothetical protein